MLTSTRPYLKIVKEVKNGYISNYSYVQRDVAMDISTRTGEETSRYRCSLAQHHNQAQLQTAMCCSPVFRIRHSHRQLRAVWGPLVWVPIDSIQPMDVPDPMWLLLG